MTIRNTLRLLGVFYGRLVQFVTIWYIFPLLVCLDQAKSGNPDASQHQNWFSAIFFSPRFFSWYEIQWRFLVHIFGALEFAQTDTKSTIKARLTRTS
jgi:hypothetical protein